MLEGQLGYCEWLAHPRPNHHTDGRAIVEKYNRIFHRNILEYFSLLSFLEDITLFWYPFYRTDI